LPLSGLPNHLCLSTLVSEDEFRHHGSRCSSTINAFLALKGIHIYIKENTFSENLGTYKAKEDKAKHRTIIVIITVMITVIIHRKSKKIGPFSCCTLAGGDGRGKCNIASPSKSEELNVCESFDSLALH